MKKHFLILMLMALLPLAGWATDINLAKMSVGDIVYGSNDNPGFLVTYEVELRLGTHYSWDGKFYKDNECKIEAVDDQGHALATNALPMATYYVIIKGIPSGGFDGEKISSFKVTAKPIDGEAFKVVTSEETFTYDGTPKTFQTVKLQENHGTADEPNWVDLVLGEDKDYTFEYSANTNAGTNTAKITFTGRGNYKGTKVHQFTISPKPLPGYSTTNYSFIALGEGQNPVYSAEPVTTIPSFVVKDGNKTLSLGTDYTIRWTNEEGGYVFKTENNQRVYTNPVNAGVYTAHIFGAGNYVEGNGAGVTQETWTLTVEKKPVRIYVQSQEKVYDGQAINPSTLTASEIIIGGLCTADNTQAIKNGITAKFKVDGLNGENPSKAGEYVLIPNIGTEAAIKTNYAPEILETGIWTIAQREVTVTAKKQTLVYTGQVLEIDKAVRTSTQDGKPATVEIEKAATDTENKLTGTTGFIAGDNFDLTKLFEISQKEGVTIKDKNTYEGAIEIVDPKPTSTRTAQSIATDIATANYKIVKVAGNVEVTGQDLTLIAGTFSKEYGYTIDFSKDFSVVNTANIKDWDVAPTYKVTNAKGEEVTAATGVLPIGVYTIEITNAQAIVPSNYEYNAEKVYTGELTITKKDPKFMVNTVNLSTGDGIAELEKYLTVEKDVVDGEEIAYEVSFAEDILDDEGKLKPSTQYTLDANGDIANAVVVTFVQPNNTAGKDAKQNANYNLPASVRGKIHLGTAGTLVLDPANTQLDGKIADAQAAGTAYKVEFGEKKMLDQEWYAMVLPFETTPAELVGALGTYVVVNRLSQSSTLGNIKFALEMEEIPAGEPFLIKAVGNNTAIAANPEQNIAAVAAGTYCDWANFTLTGTKEINSAIKDAEVSGIVKFTGSYKSVELKGVKGEEGKQVSWLCDTGYGKKDADGKPYNGWLKPKSNPRTMKPMDAWLIWDVAWDGYAPTITVEDFDGQTTAIKTLNADKINNLKTADGWYTLGGMKLQSTPTQKGVYINNGKKVVIK